MKPPKSILDKTFQYTNAIDTDIRKRFDTERERLGQQRQVQAEQTAKIVAIFAARRAEKQ